MGAWTKIDDLRDLVAKKPLVDIDARSIKTVEEAQRALRESNFEPDRLVAMGWEVLLSRRRQDGVVLWHLSARLYPYGRSSTENDWKILGRIAARVGAPRDPSLAPEDPAAPVHWSWTEQ